MDFMPVWTKAGSWSLGRDPLGIQATSVRIYRSLVPGLTNVTNRLRYYSFYCWVVHHYEQTEYANDNSRWRLFIRRAEALYALACEIYNPMQSDGLAGSDWAREYRQQMPARKVDLRPYTDRPGDRTAKQYLLAPRGNFGQFYVASMTEVGFLLPSSGVPIVSEARGQELAKAFGSAIGKDAEQLLSATLKSGVVARDALQRIGKAIYPSLIAPNSKEMRLLRDFLLASNPDTDGSTIRRSSAWLLLDLARSGLSLDDDGAIRRAFYHRTLPDGSPYSRTGRTLDRWRAYQANELCHIALEAWLNAIASKARGPVNSLAPDTLLDELLAEVLTDVRHSVSWETWAHKAGTTTVEEEEALTEAILSGLRSTDGPEDKNVLSSATRLLAVLWRKWRSDDVGVRGEVARFAGTNGRSLASVIETLDRQASQSVRAAMAELLRRNVLFEHLVIAGRKLAASGTYTYHFTIIDGTLSNGSPATYGYTNPRLRNLARFLSDAQLYDAGKVTLDGLKFLDENQPA